MITNEDKRQTFVHTYISTPYRSLHQGKLQLPCTPLTNFYKLKIKDTRACAFFN